MDEKIKIIRENLSGDYASDIEFLNSLYEEETSTIEDAKTTIEAINIVIDELNKEQEKLKENENKEIEENVEKSDEEKEIDQMIENLLEHIDKESDDEALKSIEEIIPKIEELTKSDDKIIYCSFKSEFERNLFERIFAGEKNVVATPYSNDVIYIIYSDLLLKKKRRTEAMEALDRAIYWNFLSREARERKLELYYKRKEIVKYLDTLKTLQMISYTVEDIADCYNKYAFIFNDLKDTKSAYAMYRLSYSYYKNEDVANIIAKFEELDPSLKEMTSDEILNLVEDNEVTIGPNNKIVKAERDIATYFIQNGMINEAKIMLENDYSMTNDEEIANVYNKLLELENSVSNTKNEDVVETEKEVEKPKKTTKKSTSTTAKKTTTKKASTKKTSTAKEAKTTKTTKTTKKAETKK